MLSKRKVITLLAKTTPAFWSSRLNNPVFIIGSGRSGTTLLANLLDYHRDIANWSELNDIWDPKGYPWHSTQAKTPPIWIEPYEYTQRWWDDTESRVKEIRALFGAYQSINRRQVFMNKTPLNTFRVPHLIEMFPSAKFINIIRDGRAVTYSYTRKQLVKINANPAPYSAAGITTDFNETALTLANFWKANIDAVDRQNQLLNLTEQGKLLEVTYEALCDDQQQVLDAICAFLQISPRRFDPGVAEIQIRNQNHKWREGFDHDLALELTAIMEPALSAKGYT